ncbi:MAG: 3-phosphoserine/phosphohydroxythreonine transaminase [Actinobacteria bacterium HGW-Actinobacteria-2]|nr:MAG: 3-phosphoserine/phosphohydroxythreonine transaminase [Actinobacteria bacterium HGW-Actinobacteria-2]
MRVYNFSAGPAMLPIEALTVAQSELTDWKGSGMSVLEVSHRGKDFVACAAETEQLLREVLAVPDNYRVLFLQGGASGQFDAIPLNLTAAGDRVDFIKTGQWSAKAIKAAKAQGLEVSVIADQAASNYTDTPAADSLVVDPSAAYLHYTPNETIGGVEFGYVPAAGEVPLVADFSSTILSRPINVADYGLIYAGAQKNMGPSGLCVTIVRDDLLGRARPGTPSIWNYSEMAAADSMLNTPPTFGVYLLGLILKWVADLGGLPAMAERNRAKAEALYGFIDASGYYSNPVAADSRSWMNVPFLQANAELDKTFVAEAAAAGLTNLAGHRSVGGMRASIYNAMPAEGVQALIDFMTDFERRNG